MSSDKTRKRSLPHSAAVSTLYRMSGRYTFKKINRTNASAKYTECQSTTKMLFEYHLVEAV
jgi:hypothetical protein